MVALPFHDRRDAGRALAEALTAYADRPDAVVLALPRGGVPVAYEVARALHAPLDIMLVRKLGVPGHEELAMGAIATGGARVLNSQIVDHLHIDAATLEQVVAREQQELRRREQVYRDNRPELALRGRSVILIDDGLATGATMAAAVEAARQQEPERVVVAVPVAPSETCYRLQQQADEVVVLATPAAFNGVGQWYTHFEQTSDSEVRELLHHARGDGGERRNHGDAA